MPHVSHPNVGDRVGCKDTPHVCSRETACGIYHGDWACICYHTGTLPINGTCPRNTVGEFHLATSNLSYEHNDPAQSRNSGIPVQIMGGSATGGQESLKEQRLTVDQGLDVAVVVGMTSVAVILSVLAGILCWKRQSLLKLFRSPTSKKRNEKGPLFSLDRFVLNPTYEVAPLLNLPVQLYRTHQILIQEQIGQGCFGKVFKGELNGEGVAVKVARKEHGAEVMKEVETMASFNHPNILRLLGIASNQDGDAPWLLFEFMDHGDLATLLRKISKQSETTTAGPKDTEDVELSTEDMMDVAYQIAEGMSYLASQHFVHRDLAARNCLVGRGRKVKVSDFGLSRDVYTCDYYKIGGSRLLPVRWMSPESVLYGRFTLESDVWAYGVLLWEIYTWAKQPFYGHSNEEVVELILEGVLLSPPPLAPPAIASLMAGSWKTEPKNRLTFAQISATFKRNQRKVDHIPLTDDELYERPRPKTIEYMQVV